MTASSTTFSPLPKTIPQVKGWPLIGNLPEFRRDPIGFAEYAWRTAGDIVQINIGPRKLIFISHPDLARQVLVERKHLFQRGKRFQGGTPLTYMLGLSLLTTDGESWLSKRRTLQPIFHRQRILGMGDQMVAAGQRMLERWQTSDKGIDLSEEMKLVTLDIINRTMFSTDVMGEVDKIGHTVEVGQHFVTKRLQVFLPIPLSWPLPAHRRFQKAMHTLDEYLYRIIGERRAAKLAGTAENKQQGDLLDMLLEAKDDVTGESMNDEQVRNEVATIYAAGHETTAVALTWTWYALTQNPEVLHKLQAEVDTVLAGRSPTVADLPKLPYTLQVLEESMRLYAPVPFSVRLNEEATELGGYPLPKGSFIAINIHNMHRHPDFWERPEEFQPERFAPEQKNSNQRAAYMPFFTGPHLCIGNSFSLMEGQLLLAMMAQRYTLELVPGQRIEKEHLITMRPKYGMKMKLIAR